MPSQALVMNLHDQIFEAGLPEYDCTVNTTLSLSCYQHCQLFCSEESVEISRTIVIYIITTVNQFVLVIVLIELTLLNFHREIPSYFLDKAKNRIDKLNFCMAL